MVSYHVLALFLALAPSFTGASACQKCHPAEYRTHAGSHHAAALQPAAARPDLADLFNARPLLERSGVAFSYSPGADGMKVFITRGGDRREAVLEWAFGAGAQAITPVGQQGGRFFEHRISWYRAAGHAARTLGHRAEASASPAQAMGVTQDAATIARCFSCHATGVKPGPDLSEMQPGVSCERCHGPGGAHVAKPSRGNIVSRSGVSAKESVQFCAECHRAPSASAGSMELADAASVRFQPVGLSASRCFQASGKLSCLTCHDAHANASTEMSKYTERCLSCHASGGRAIVECRRAARQDCVPCHMKKQSPFPFLTFTDHRIRVYR